MHRLNVGEGPVQVPAEVLRGIDAVLESGRTNMFDVATVCDLADEFGYEETVRWIRANEQLYCRGLFNSFEEA